MKYLKQFSIIMAISFAGEILHEVVPLPIPASIYGIIILMAGLISGLIKLSHVGDAAHFLIEIMPVMFIPAAVKLITMWDDLKSVWIQYLVLVVVSTLCVMFVAGRATQFVIEKEKKGGKAA